MLRWSWECRYSSCEMMYLEFVGRNVRIYLDHSPGSADVYTLEQVRAGALDREVGGAFGAETLKELHASADALANDAVPPPETKEQARERRRREG